MTVEQLKEVMKYHLESFNDEGVEISDDTVHKHVLAESDGFGAANSKAIYKAVIRWTLAKQEHRDQPWPRRWMNLSVDKLARRLMGKSGRKRR